MQEFTGKVAVITGAASGIGRAIAGRCAQEGMKVVLADIEEAALSQAEQELNATGAAVVAVRTDVSKPGDVEALARQTLEAFGAVHLLFNNAGVGAGGSIWESSLADWEWVIGVNLWGVIHGLRVFVPIMLAQATEGHIVNTASIAGLITYHANAPYHVTKHAVVALSENLKYSLANQKSLIKTSVLCPGWVKTQIMDSARNRPPELQEVQVGPLSPEYEAVETQMRQLVEDGIPSQQVADEVFKAIRAEQFYILTHPNFTYLVEKRMRTILRSNNPGGEKPKAAPV